MSTLTVSVGVAPAPAPRFMAVILSPVLAQIRKACLSSPPVGFATTSERTKKVWRPDWRGWNSLIAAQPASRPQRARGRIFLITLVAPKSVRKTPGRK
ncbi:hypothetical protein D3C87_1788290 [compost metagenome]